VAYFRIRAVAAGLVAGVAALVGLFVVRNDATYPLRRTHVASAASGRDLGASGAWCACAASGAAPSSRSGRSGSRGGIAGTRVGSFPVELPPARIADGIAGGSADRND
jgi:hypothetical protein